jgi:hypothetical protein
MSLRRLGADVNLLQPGTLRRVDFRLRSKFKPPHSERMSPKIGILDHSDFKKSIFRSPSSENWKNVECKTFFASKFTRTILIPIFRGAILPNRTIRTIPIKTSTVLLESFYVLSGIDNKEFKP